jgi:hypothetical protein
MEMREEAIRKPVLRTQADYEREIARILAEIDRLDESIGRHQEETRRSRERTDLILARIASVK